MPAEETVRSVRTLLKMSLLASLVAVSFGCESPTHASIEKWQTTVKGPKKLEKALKDTDLDMALRAHAAQALVAIDKSSVVKEVLGQFPEKDRAAVLAALAPRLWDDCKLADEAQVPTRKQQAAKDGLFELRDLAAPGEQTLIDGYLLDWLSGFYEERSRVGNHKGEKIIHAIGQRAAPKLLAAARATLATPGEGNTLLVLGDELLKGIASTGSAEAVGFLVDLAEKSQADASLQKRALGALYYSYTKSSENPEPADPKALHPHLVRLEAIARSTTQPPENINVSFEVIAAAGKPECLSILTSLAQTKDAARMWRAIQFGLACGGAEGVVALAEALPEDSSYQREVLEIYFWELVTELGPPVAGPARTLLGSKSWVARLTGMHVLSKVGEKGDAAKVRALSGDKAKLKGWWGKGKVAKKPEPTLGQEAIAVAQGLEKK
jgi:hypothetical protein